jgi:hypothetical protein
LVHLLGPLFLFGFSLEESTYPTKQVSPEAKTHSLEHGVIPQPAALLLLTPSPSHKIHVHHWIEHLSPLFLV